MSRLITRQEIAEAAEGAYTMARVDNGGHNAHYIPYLANVPSDLFALTVTLPDGEVFSFGDDAYLFGIESVSKVATAILAMKQWSPEMVLRKIGADATGLPFSSIFSILLENDHPSTPLVNAGAISTCSMVKPLGNPVGKWKAIVDNMVSLFGSEPSLIDELYRSESDTNYNNRSMTWLLKKHDRLYDDPMMSLDLYTRQCSLGVTCRQLSAMAATIANGGVNPLTGERAFPEEISPKIISMMASVGFYQHTGDWMFSSGLPAKTGVGGGIVGVLPGLLGIAAFSPRLDQAGNSVRAQAAIKQFMQTLGLGIYNSTQVELA
ncbi:MAG: glutaminase A [Muribaculaceae bacterium]|nr:glutaminase A [Muribaculaceae bacterium]